MGVANGYMQKKAQEARAERLKIASTGEPTAKAMTPMDSFIGKVKAAFTTDAPATPASPAASPTAAISAPSITPTPSVETVAFNDDVTVPNAPEPFKSSYQDNQA